jgi:hypothetical protein
MTQTPAPLAPDMGAIIHGSGENVENGDAQA